MTMSPHPADDYGSSQPSGGSYKATSNSFKEGIICTGIWAILAAAFVSGLKLWGNHFHPGKDNISLEEWATFLGTIIGQFVLMAVYLSAVVYYRRRKNVTSFILLDWRWWVGLVIFSILLKNPPPAWLWVGLIYQVRLSMSRGKRLRDWMKTSRALWFLAILLSGGLPVFVNVTSAQELPTPTTAPTDEPQVPNDAKQPQATPTSETKVDEKAEKKKEREEKIKKILHGGAIVVAPIPVVSPALGAGIVPVAGYIFPFEENKKNPEPSVVGAAGLITDNGTRGWGVGSDIYLKEARYEIEAVYARGNIDYNLYGSGFANGNAGLKLPLEQTGDFFFLKFMRRLVWDIYIGGRFVNGSSFITLRPNDGNIPPIPPDIGVHTNLRALGFEVERDSRPNRFYPLKGSLIQFTGDFFGKDLGSKYSFQSYKFTFNKYASLGQKQVLAYNLFLCGTGGEPPFYGNCIYGTSNELRGYTAGRYLDKYMFATQLEYRLDLRWRLGVVAFGGVGEVAPGPAKFRTDQFLPAGGTGIRFLLSKKYHVNLRTDFAWGKDNFTWSMGVGEAF